MVMHYHKKVFYGNRNFFLLKSTWFTLRAFDHKRHFWNCVPKLDGNKNPDKSQKIKLQKR